MDDHAVQPGVVTRIEKPRILRERGSPKGDLDRDSREAAAVAKSRLRRAWYGIRHQTLCAGYGSSVTRWLYPLKSRMFVPISCRGRSPSTWLLRPDPSVGHGPGSNNPFVQAHSKYTAASSAAFTYCEHFSVLIDGEHSRAGLLGGGGPLREIRLRCICPRVPYRTD